MLQHGQSVHEQYKCLIGALERGEGPQVLLDIYAKFKLPSFDALKQYNLMHDCGKSLCLEIENGKRQYPNHAALSAEQYSVIFPHDDFTRQLILHDMDFHILRGDDLTTTCKSVFAPILYFTAHAEVEANAEMFGGRGSDSYKIKAKRLLQAGKKLLQQGE